MSRGRDRAAIVGVTLDVGGVLTLPPVLDVLRTHGIDATADDLLVAHHRGVGVEDALLARDPGAPDAVGPARTAAIETTADALGAAGAARDAVVSALHDIATSGTPWDVVAPGALDLVPALAAAGFHVAVLSNSDGTVADQLVALGLCQAGRGPLPRVGAVVDSGVVGVRKPDPAIFAVALDALGTSAAATAHLGDTIAFDVLGAARAGLVPVHYDATARCRGDHLHVAALSELPDLLLSLA